MSRRSSGSLPGSSTLILMVGFALTLLFVQRPTSAGSPRLTFISDTSWKATGEAPGPGWNSDPSYDDSTWVDASEVFSLAIQGVTLPGIWSTADVSGPPEESWFRKTFNLSSATASATGTFFFDDDGEVYVNGTLVFDDKDGTADNPAIGLNLLPYLRVGENVIAAHGYNVIPSFRYFVSEVDIELTPPATPTGLHAQAINNAEIDLTWSEPNGPVDSFLVERKNGAGAFTTIATPAGTATSYRDQTVAADTTYSYVVLAVNAAGNSAAPAAVSATTPSAAPTNLKVTLVSNAEIDLAWTPPGAVVGSYQVERQDPGGVLHSIGSAPTDATGFQDGGVAANTSYGYRVGAPNGSGGFDYSNSVGALTLPADPSGLTAAAVSQTEVALAWSDHNPVGPSTFRIERSQDGGKSFSSLGKFTPPTAGGTVQYDDGGLTPNTAYVYRVWATNTPSGTAVGGGDSLHPTNTAAVSTLPTPPAAPSALTASPPSSSEVTLSWKDNAGDETGFSIERKEPGGDYEEIARVGASAGTGKTVQYVDVVLAPSTSYSYRVRAFNDGGFSAYSNEATLETPVPGKLVVTPKKLVFPVTKVGHTSKLVLHVKNAGPGPLLVTVGILSLPYAVSGGGTQVLAKGQVLEVPLTFTPGAKGAAAAVLQIQSDDPLNRSISVPVKGHGT